MIASLRELNSKKELFRQQREAQWDMVSAKGYDEKSMGGAYHRRIRDVYRFLIPPDSRVLELGCAAGKILGGIDPKEGLGVDFSKEMIARAKSSYPELKFIHADVHKLSTIKGPFDFIILSDLINDVWDVQTVLEEVLKLSTPKTRILLNVQSHLWELPLRMTMGLGLSIPKLPQNWFTRDDILNILNLTGFQVIHQWQEILLPLDIPVLNKLFNRYLVKFWPLNHLALSNFFVTRLAPLGQESHKQPSVSIVVAARNEAGNIDDIFRRTPEIGSKTELIFVEGHSSDNTYETIKKAIAANPGRNARLFRQTGKGKGDAIRKGFKEAKGDVLMILDADLTVSPEDLPRFYNALLGGKGEFINGVRLVYPLEKEAMRFFNIIGNKFFSLTLSWLLGQPIKDTLCGTKVLWRRDYEVIEANRSYFGEFDPFGDFDLIFGATKHNLKLVDLPVRYGSRNYGETNISRWRHGLLLLKMVVFAAKRLKFR